MKNIYLNIHKPNLRNLKKAKKNIENNNVIGIPTETVYGLAANAYSDKAVKKIFKLKKRPFFNPTIIHFKSINDTKNDIIINSDFIKLYDAFCPGPITFVLKRKKISKISKIATAGKKTLAIRFPKHRVMVNLLKILKSPLAAPSANISSKLSPTSASDVVEEFGSKVKLILDGGKCKVGLESTIVDLTGKPTILRPGYITADEVKKILKRNIKIKKNIKKINAPGQLKLHYSPGIPVRLNVKTPKKNEAYIQFSNKKKNKNYFFLSQKGNLKNAANRLYSLLRLIKNMQYKSIAVGKIPNKDLGIAINDRLRKAANK